MKKKILTRRFFASVFLFSAAILTINAEQLVVEEKTGGVTSYYLGDSPVLTIEDNSLVVKTNNANAEFSLSDVSKYYFRSGTTSVPDSQEVCPLMSVAGDEIRLSGFSTQTLVRVYKVSGQSVGAYRTNEVGSLTISLANFSDGVYLVKTNSSTIKITKR
ncbi:MAG: T9SS type A sorting domain-containing protein [Paludibacteraceae bacterium]|nr:T9SS type A sorting domain-containing protein [Prevotellaceae bacterium]